MNWAELVQICFWEYECILCFQENIKITIHSKLIIKQWEELFNIEYPYVNSHILCNQLRHSIISSQFDSKWSLSIHLMNDIILVLNKEDLIESFYIQIGEDIYVA